MSRIEKGTQRFRPTVVARRAPQADHANDAVPRPAPVVPSADAPSTASAARTDTPPQRRATSSSVPTPIVPTRMAPRPRVVPSTGASENRVQPAARSYAFASQPTKVRVPIHPRAPSQPPRSADVLHAESSSISPYERFLHAAQADPHGVLHMDTEADPSAIAEQAAETWQTLDPAIRAQYNVAEAPRSMPTSSAPPARTRAPRKRTGTSISDDEAEYKQQCAQQENGMDGSELPPLRVDIGTTRMESIAVTNWKSGRASSRTFELERVRARQLKKRRSEAHEDAEQGGIKQSETPVPSTPRDTPAPSDVSEEPQLGENRFAVQTRIVDGKIVLDEQSLYANYRDDEQQEREQRHWEVIDEREGDQFVNSASRSKQRRTQRWTAEETERFFQAISQWGTDFEMITRLFPRRTRREIKAKWTKESRQNPQRLDAAFQRRVAVDLHAYGRAAGVDLSGPPPTITPRPEPKSDVEIVSESSVQ